MNAHMDTVKHLRDFQVVELRRYTIKPEERQNFALYFESYFPEAFEQLGAIVFGQFLSRDDDSLFIWLRGFRDMYARATVNGAFYYGPLWREHSGRMNRHLIDSDNVLLLRPLSPERSIPVFPAVDPVEEPDGADGIVIAQIFAITPNELETAAKQAENIFARYRAAGMHEAGVLVTLDTPNNFPQHPIRTDGPFLVWLGLVRNNESLDKNFETLTREAAQVLRAAGLLRDEPELLIMNPTRRSRLRWSAQKQSESSPSA